MVVLSDKFWHCGAHALHVTSCSAAALLTGRGITLAWRHVGWDGQAL